MVTRIAFAAILLAAACSFATAQSSTATTAQSSTATSGTTQPMTSAPASSNTLPNGQPKWMPPPAARSGEKGLPVGPGAFTGDPLEVKRVK
jgi:hypothetical protein